MCLRDVSELAKNFHTVYWNRVKSKLRVSLAPPPPLSIHGGFSVSPADGS